jgi:hypothetical protein
MKHHALPAAGRRRVRMTRPRRPAVDNASCRIVASIKRVPLQLGPHKARRLAREPHAAMRLL